MSTRCRIAAIYNDGSVRSIYCHHDGYISGVGKILDKYYRDRDRVEELIYLGNMSSLGINPCPNVAGWSDPEYFSRNDLCLIYANRGDIKPEDYIAKMFDSFDTYNKWLAERYMNSDEEFYYLYKDGEWFIQNPEDSSLVKLSEKID